MEIMPARDLVAPEVLRAPRGCRIRAAVTAIISQRSQLMNATGESAEALRM